MKAPCKGCMSRHEKCHSECEKYLAFRAGTEARRIERLKQQQITNASFDLSIQARKRVSRGKDKPSQK